MEKYNIKSSSNIKLTKLKYRNTMHELMSASTADEI